MSDDIRDWEPNAVIATCQLRVHSDGYVMWHRHPMPEGGDCPLGSHYGGHQVAEVDNLPHDSFLQSLADQQGRADRQGSDEGRRVLFCSCLVKRRMV